MISARRSLQPDIVRISTSSSCPYRSLGVSSPLCVIEISKLTRIEEAVENTTIAVIFQVLVYIQMSQPTTCFGLRY